MNQNKTQLVLIVDRSGSMESIKTDAQGGINTLIEKQKQESGECHLTIVDFDGIIETVYDGDIKDCKGYTLVPRGSTALFDAVGKTINEVGFKLASLYEKDRPGLVAVFVVTDGQENASREFTSETVKTMIEHQSTKYNWQFDFMCADKASVFMAKSLGFKAAVQYDVNNVLQMYGSVSSKVTRMRGLQASGCNPSCTYTDEELTSMNAGEVVNG